MLWLLAKTGADRKRVVLAACDCAETALKYTDNPRVAECLRVTRAWVDGAASIEDVRAAAAYAAAADAAADAAYAAAYAAAAARKCALRRYAVIVRRYFPKGVTL